MLENRTEIGLPDSSVDLKAQDDDGGQSGAEVQLMPEPPSHAKPAPPPPKVSESPRAGEGKPLPELPPKAGANLESIDRRSGTLGKRNLETGVDLA